jgi:hypothetical protein
MILVTQKGGSFSTRKMTKRDEFHRQAMPHLADPEGPFVLSTRVLLPRQAVDIAYTRVLSRSTFFKRSRPYF